MERYYLNTDPIPTYGKLSKEKNYVDKTGLIQFVNEKSESDNQLVLVSRPFGFGKTYAAVMLKAYYTIGYDTTPLFKDKKIFEIDPALTNCGAFDVIYIDMLDFRCRAEARQAQLDREANEKGIEPEKLDWIEFLKDSIVSEIVDMYGEDVVDEDGFFPTTLVNTVRKNGRKIVWICDEWDNFLRESTDDPNAGMDFIDLLTSLFRDKYICATVFAAAYMTGILPMIRLRSFSSLVEFDNYTMFTPGDLAPYIGFTESEVKDLLARNPGCSVTYEEMAELYDGYSFRDTGPLFNPKTVIEAINKNICMPYWCEINNEQFRKVVPLQNERLREDVERLLRGEEVPVSSGSFDNDLSTLPAAGAGATLAAMVHLGYLGYVQETRCARIPNKEVRGMYLDLLKNSAYPTIYRKISEADDILKDTLKGEEQKVAEAFRKIHYAYANPKAGNSEATLKETVDLAYYTAERFYVRMYELPTGEGYADMVLYPKAGKAMPLMVIELKKNKAVNTGLDQIKERRYPDRFKDYGGREMLLVTVSYDADKLEKEYYCKIERVQLPNF